MEDTRQYGMIRKRLYSVLYMTALTLVFTAAVSLVYGLNRHRIALNRKTKMERVVLQVLNVPIPPAAPAEEVMRIFGRRVRPRRLEDGSTIYLAVDPRIGSVEGYAFPLKGSGLWGPIYGMMAVTPQFDRVLGIAFYRHSETPGLGGRITEAWFSRQFRGRPIPVSRQETYFLLCPKGTARGPGEVDAVTGATATSLGVQRMINSGLRHVLPLLARMREVQGNPVPASPGGTP